MDIKSPTKYEILRKNIPNVKLYSNDGPYWYNSLGSLISWSESQYLDPLDGFVVYNADPIKNGVRFDFINQKYNRFDCDTYVICEKFQNLGYNKVYLNKNIKILHIE